MDEYPMTVQTKGGYMSFRPKTLSVYVADKSNKLVQQAIHRE